MFGLFKKPTELPTADTALPGRPEAIPTAKRHAVNGNPLKGPFPEGLETVIFGLGCFWGAERMFWKLPGVYTTAVGYAAGQSPNPTYEEVCSGRTGHNEVVLVVFDPSLIPFSTLLKTFWEGHNPTQGMRQGNDVGTQYRSAIFSLEDDEQLSTARRMLEVLAEHRFTPQTDVAVVPAFYPAEARHQGYCDTHGMQPDRKENERVRELLGVAALQAEAEGGY